MKNQELKKSKSKKPSAKHVKKMVTQGRKKKRKSKASKALGPWPHKRDVFYRPERLTYVRRSGVTSESCVFCDLRDRSAQDGPQLLLHIDTYSMIVLNKYPYNTGHLLVLPREHCGDLLRLPHETFLALQESLKKALHALQEIYNPDGINMGANLGRAAGAGVPDHLHYHLIPRWFGDTNFFPLIAETKVLVETLEQTYERLLPYFRDGKEAKPVGENEK